LSNSCVVDVDDDVCVRVQKSFKLNSPSFNPLFSHSRRARGPMQQQTSGTKARTMRDMQFFPRTWVWVHWGCGAIF